MISWSVFQFWLGFPVYRSGFSGFTIFKISQKLIFFWIATDRFSVNQKTGPEEFL
jgi:hypothetical protein